MIIDKQVYITLNSKNISHYKKLGYKIDINPSGKKLLVDIIDLSKGSHVLVNIKCDYCDKIKIVSFKEYNRNISHQNKFSCSNKCGSIKKKEISIIKYGVESPSMLNEIKDKNKKTNLDRYCKEYYMGTDEFKSKSKEIMLDRYGVENAMYNDEIKKKLKTTILDRYGVENVFQSDIIKEKINNNNFYKYGVKHYSQTDEFILKMKKTKFEKYGSEYYNNYDKIKKTNFERYGVESYMGTDDFISKSKRTFFEKYGVEFPTQSDLLRKCNNINCKDINYISYIGYNISSYYCNNGHKFEIKSDNYHSRIKYKIPLCTICNPIGDQKSIKEKELFNYIKSIYSGDIISSYRDQLEIDIYLPELKLGFEFNGLYFHSNKFKDKNYHLDKTNYFKDKGIRIIHIWEDYWVFKKEIVKSQIKNKLKVNSDKIFARKCYVKEIKDSKIVSKFLNNNHIQGKVNSSLKLGLYYDEELVSLMTFDHFEGRKKMELGGYNLNRFCNKCGINVIGGASKLLSHFINNYEVKRIVSYADKDWSVGNLYEVLGFVNIGGNGPDYKYIVDNQRVHKSRYKKSKLKTELTEAKQMEINGFYKIYDCGKLKFEYKKVS